jgi:gamma-glutamylcysteine synthetase
MCFANAHVDGLPQQTMALRQSERGIIKGNFKYYTLLNIVAVDEVPETFIVDDVDEVITMMNYIAQDFMAGKLEVFEGERPSKDDFMNHLGNLYPEVKFLLVTTPH